MFSLLVYLARVVSFSFVSSLARAFVFSLFISLSLSLSLSLSHTHSLSPTHTLAHTVSAYREHVTRSIMIELVSWSL
jgi:hypothetical protein